MLAGALEGEVIMASPCAQGPCGNLPGVLPDDHEARIGVRAKGEKLTLPFRPSPRSLRR